MELDDALEKAEMKMKYWKRRVDWIMSEKANEKKPKIELPTEEFFESFWDTPKEDRMFALSAIVGLMSGAGPDSSSGEPKMGFNHPSSREPLSLRD
jgi:hypothetical protein